MGTLSKKQQLLIESLSKFFLNRSFTEREGASGGHPRGDLYPMT